MFGEHTEITRDLDNDNWNCVYCSLYQVWSFIKFVLLLEIFGEPPFDKKLQIKLSRKYTEAIDEGDNHHKPNATTF